MAKIVKFSGNPRPAKKHFDLTTIIILPVVKIERAPDGSPRPYRSRRGRRRKPQSGDAA